MRMRFIIYLSILPILALSGCGPGQAVIAGVAVAAAGGGAAAVSKATETRRNGPPRIVQINGPGECSGDLTPAFTWTAEDESVGSLKFWLAIDMPPSPAYETRNTSWTSAPLQPGNHTFFILAIDKYGRVSETENYSWIALPDLDNTNITVPDVVFIPGNVFTMGNTFPGEGWLDEEPLHEVILSSYNLADKEISNRQFSEFLNAGYSACYHPGQFIELLTNSWFAPTDLKDDHAVVYVSHEAALTYCQWLSAVTGDTWRLPTEAEWEYAYRGGLVAERYPTGDSLDGNDANFYESGDAFESGLKPHTTPSCYYAANGFGLYDMGGNVWEWCSDWYSETYYLDCESQGTVADPTGPDLGTARVIRGGSWAQFVRYLKCSSRYYRAPADLDDATGFRCVKEE